MKTTPQQLHPQQSQPARFNGNGSNTRKGHARENSRPLSSSDGNNPVDGPVGTSATSAAGKTQQHSSQSGHANEVNSSSSSSGVGGGFGGGGFPAEELGNNRLIYLISKAVGKICIITTTDGSRYKGLLLATDLSRNPASLSVVIQKPQLVTKGLIDEKNNLDDKALPQTLIVQAKDLIDFEIDLDINEPVKSYPKEKIATPKAPAAAAVDVVSDQPSSKETVKAEPTPGTTPAPQTLKSAEVPAQAEKAAAPAGAVAAPPAANATPSNATPVATATATRTTSPSKSEFKTDSDISSDQRGKTFQERELVRWQPEANNLQGLTLEEDHATSGNGKVQWDQFKANQERFGVESTYDEHLYTTRIDKSAADYKQRVLMADKLAREIEGSATTDRHILEERGFLVDDSGMDEEDKYSGVDRRGDELMAALKMSTTKSPPKPMASHHETKSVLDENKYVTPRQRAANYHNDPAIISSSAVKKKPTPSSIPAKPTIPSESFRLTAQSEINALREFSANFKIPHKIPQDLLPILAKDKLKQSEILKKQQQEQAQAQAQAQVQAQAQSEPHSQQQSAAQSVQPTPQPTPQPPSSQNHTPPVPPVPQTPQQAPQLAPSQQQAKPAVPPTAPAAAQPTAQPAVKKSGSKFKLNPSAASFTPTFKPSTLASPSKSSATHISQYQSPHIPNSRTYSANGSISSQGSANKRYPHQITAQDFFGVGKVPTDESQAQKTRDFQSKFNLFNYTKQKALESGSETPVIFEKSYQTPPTWDSTTEESYSTIYPKSSSASATTSAIYGARTPLQMSASYMPSPIMAQPQPPMMQGAPMAAAPIPYNFQVPPQFHQFQHHHHQQQPHFPQQVAATPMWFIPPPQGFNIINNPYQTGGAGVGGAGAGGAGGAGVGGGGGGGGAGGGHGQQTRRYK
ncbi:uncharacterized protein LODBEIA_P21510 [Lodderomyces beijingensis]|uniref:LsmAD domain-containing protein n=1 Tax=Lodderomyces beijingensis TaxID=1775926 RepID=A0ABP0ZKJ0_9ASCO